MTSVLAEDPRRRLAVLGLGEDDRGRSSATYIVAFILAFTMHGVAGAGAGQAKAKKLEERVQMALVKPPPPPPPPPEPPKPPPPEEKKPPPPPPKKEQPPPPPPPNQEPPKEPPKEPVPIVTGISMSSTVKGNSGMNVRVGNTTYGDPNKEKFTKPGDVQQYAGGTPDFKPVRQASISVEARVLKDVKAPYPRELADQGVEGVVVLLVDVTTAGITKDARIVKGSGNASLDALALAAVKKFTWKPAEVDGAKVDSRLRYTYRFELVD